MPLVFRSQNPPMVHGFAPKMDGPNRNIIGYFDTADTVGVMDMLPICEPWCCYMNPYMTGPDFWGVI